MIWRPLASTTCRWPFAACGAVLNYASVTQQSPLTHVRNLVVERSGEALRMDPATRRNLELTATLRGEPAPTLLSLLDTTVTPGGARLLRGWLANPLRTAPVSRRAMRAVAELIERSRHDALRAQLRGFLRHRTDRRAHRAEDRAPARPVRPARKPRAAAGDCRARSRAAAPHLARALRTSARSTPNWSALLARAIAAEPAVALRDGGVIATGFDAELDELRAIQTDAGAFLLAHEEREARAHRASANLKKSSSTACTGSTSKSRRASRVRFPDDYRRRQTMKNAERYITPELKLSRTRRCRRRIAPIARERVICTKRCWRSWSRRSPNSSASRTRSPPSTCCARFAERGRDARLALPGRSRTIRASRSAAAGTGRRAAGRALRRHDVELSAHARRLVILTGPNMGGKSTYMRQTAVIVLLAHFGSFVPAASATIGPIDAIYTRIGAADDLAGGRSTFMVEMTEAAAILNAATPQSLVLIDEIGRGTSTFDGLALAWAIARHLAQRNQSLTMFATHYFELTALAKQLPACVNAHFDAAEFRNERGDQIVFLHEVAAGPASRSYGLQVAKLAGVPGETVRQAQKYLTALEESACREESASELFGAADPDAAGAAETEAGETMTAMRVLDQLRIIDPDALSPREALEAIYALKKLTAS
jgi:DNA mismatch repair protein MutS